MEIIVEIGTDEQKAFIEGEIRAVFGAIAKKDMDLIKVIVAKDFIATVRGLPGMSAFQSGVQLGEYKLVPQAKVINTPDSSYIVLSDILYTEFQDEQTRYETYFHEYTHVRNAALFKNINARISQAEPIYLQILEVFLDEYLADQFAYSLSDDVFQSKSLLWNSSLQQKISSYMIALTNPAHMQTVKKLIGEHRANPDIYLLLNKLGPIVDSVTRLLSHTASLSDCYPDQLPFDAIIKSDFVNDRAIALIDYARFINSGGDYNPLEGLPYIKGFMKNFGVEFSDTPQGLLDCHVDWLDLADNAPGDDGDLLIQK